VRAEQAFLNGVVGPNVINGDATTFYFEYGQNKSYGSTTPSGTVVCPPGGRCDSAGTRHVSYHLQGLTACTTYHYRVDASNPDVTNPSGLVTGGDKSFRTDFLAPIKSVHAPRSVAHSGQHNPQFFTVTVKLTTAAALSVKLERTIFGPHHSSSTVTVADYSSNGSKTGTVNVTFKAPSNTGHYTIKVTGSESCGNQTVSNGINVF
jgi:hypothetical protein